MKNKIHPLTLFLLGVLCFFSSQILLRIPLLNYMNKNISFTMFSIKYQLLVNILILASAGIFEEGFRFLFRNFLLKDFSKDEKGLFPFKNTIQAPIIFGLGHGLCELVYVLILAGLTLSFENYILILIERFLAVTFHICQSILIFSYFNLNKKYRGLIFGIILHTLFNSGIYLSSLVGIKGLYILMLAFNLIYIIYLYKKKIYFMEE